MVDVALIKVSAGKGGDGAVSFYRAKHVLKGGPDGGDGGEGGSVVLRGERNLRTLDYFAGRARFEARPGDRGSKNRRTGASADDVEILVPQGTVVYEIDMKNDEVMSKKMLYELLRTGKSNFDGGDADVKAKVGRNRLVKLGEVLVNGERLVVARGGRGGRGNDAFKSPSNTTPREAEEGKPGEVAWLVLELKLLADVGLVGLPNAGKSTLLSVLTAARPKVADYEFTTLEPNLGVMRMRVSRSARLVTSRLAVRDDKSALKSLANLSSQSVSRELVIADIPGLIEGASQGKGLGDEFLRHVERTKTLVHVIGVKVFGQDQTVNIKDQVDEVAGQLIRDYEVIRNELEDYHPDLLEKREVVVVNKIDLFDKAQGASIKKQVLREFGKKGIRDVVFVSAATREGVGELEEVLVK